MILPGMTGKHHTLQTKEQMSRKRLGIPHGFHSNNKTGAKGVSFWGTRYVAYIRREGKAHHLGYYEELGDAATAYMDASNVYRRYKELYNAPSQ